MSELTDPREEPSMIGNRTRASLLVRLRNLRDQKSWEEFVELYGPLIVRYLRRAGASEQEAIDLAQDILLIVLKHIGSFEYDASRSFRAWLRKVATNRAYRHLNQRKRRPPTGGTTHVAVVHQVPDDECAQDQLFEAEWQKRRLELAIQRVRSKVKGKSWRIFEMVDLEHMTYPQVAEALNMKIGAVYTALSRVRERLRKAMEEIDD